MKIRAITGLAGLVGLTLASAAPLVPKNPPVPPADAAAPLLVWDVAPELRAGLPRNFRTSADELKPKGVSAPDRTGLAALHASGSAEFTPAGLSAMLARCTGPVTVFDLRQEDHAFINDEPVSWMATNNWANVGRSHDDIVAGEQARVAEFKAGVVVVVSDDAAKKGGEAAAAEHLTVARAQTEREVVTAAGAAYVRLTVTDHARPLDTEVDRFITAVRALPTDGWAHFHCRAGKGRTTTFLALYDMLRNASHVSLQDIVDRQSLLVGDYNLLAKEKQAAEAWKVGISADRAAFVRAFYDYARANPGGRPQLWSEWLHSSPGQP